MPSPFSATSAATSSARAYDEGLRAFFTGTYKQMGVAMVITGLFAWIFGQDLSAMLAGEPTAIVPPGLLAALFFSPLKWALILGPLVMAMVMGGMINRFSAATARTMLYAFSGIMGISLSTIFVTYTDMSIAQAFFATAAAFAGLSLFGYTTGRDLSAMGRFMVMGLIGLVVVSLFNLFIGSEPLSMAISVIAIIVFSGLTAWDTQRLRNDYLDMAAANADQEDLGRLSVIGAFSLYLNYLNIMLALLSLFGNRE